MKKSKLGKFISNPSQSKGIEVMTSLKDHKKLNVEEKKIGRKLAKKYIEEAGALLVDFGSAITLIDK